MYPAWEQLIPYAHSLAVAVCRSRGCLHIADDARAVAEIALWECSERFDADLGVQFPAYARHRIIGAAKDLCSHERRDVPLDDIGDVAALPQREEQPCKRRARAKRPTFPTKREIEVADMLSRGMTYKSIATALSLSPSTVQVHAENLRRKVAAHTQAHLVRSCIERGYIRLVAASEGAD